MTDRPNVTATTGATPAGAAASGGAFDMFRVVEADDPGDDYDDQEETEDHDLLSEDRSPWPAQATPGRADSADDEMSRRSERPTRMQAPTPAYPARGSRPVPAQGRNALAAHRHAFGRRGNVEV